MHLPAATAREYLQQEQEQVQKVEIQRYCRQDVVIRSKSMLDVRKVIERKPYEDCGANDRVEHVPLTACEWAAEEHAYQANDDEADQSPHEELPEIAEVLVGDPYIRPDAS